jgi:formate dehydrogenase major subunit
MGESVDSLCPYCGVVCQVRYHLTDGRIAWAEGLDGPSNRGRLCVKGRFGWDYAAHPDRLTVPLIRRDDAPKTPSPADPMAQFRAATWAEALDRAADGILAIRERNGPAALGGFGTAKGSNEEGYLFQKLVRTGLGTNSVDHCARLCHSSSVVALIDQLGSGAATAAYTQVENADLALVVGINPSRSFPVAASILKRAARQHGVKLIVVDPRASEFAEHADIVVTHKPGTDIPLLNAMAHTLIAEGLCDEEFLRRRVSGYAAFRRSIEPWSPEAVAPLCGVDAALIREAARAYGHARAAITFWGMGITQHVHGVRNARCLVNLALLTGNVGRPGTGLHPMRGQNNVQGVSDMGVLPNFLPGYAKVSDPAERSRFEQAWGAAVPAAPGLTIVEMINATALGQIKGLYFMGENPAMSDPDAGHVREALCRLDHLVVQDIFLTETAALADAVLPATSMFEKWGSFTNTNRQVQISRPVLAPPGDAAQDLWILQEIARRLGLDWSYAHPSGVWAEMRSLWPAIEGISWERLERDGSAQYPCSMEDRPGEDVLFAERFATPDGRAKLVPVEPVAPAEDIDESYPYVLITGRMLEHWHTGVMTRRSHLLNELEPQAFVCVNGRDLTALGASIGDALRVSSRRGTITARARLDDSLPKGAVFMPFCYAEAAANLLTNDALDPESKIPEYKFCAVRVDRVGKRAAVGRAPRSPDT